MRFHNRIMVAAILLAASVFGTHASAQTAMLGGPPVAVTGATNAAPPVISFSSGALGSTSANDWVVVTNVGGNTAVNGVWQCSAVSATSCTLAGPIGNGTYTSGGTIQLLGSIANGSGTPLDVSPCIKSSVFIFSNGTSNAQVTLEGTSNPFPRLFNDPVTGTQIPLMGTPWSVLATVSNPDSGASGNGFYTPATNVNFLRATVGNWVSGTMYAVLTCQKSDGTRVR